MINRIEIVSNWRNTAVNVLIDGVWVDPKISQKIRMHSHDGFSVGYGGSGPAQCALGILLYVTNDEQLSMSHYQDFKWEHVAGWEPGNIYEVDVQGWIKQE